MNKYIYAALIFIITAVVSFAVPGLKWASETGHSFKPPVISADKSFAILATDEGKIIWINLADGTNSLIDKKLPIIESKYATAFKATPLITSKNEVYAPNTDGRLYIKDEKGKDFIIPSAASWGPFTATPTEIMMKEKRRILCPSLDGNIYAVNPDDKSWFVWYSAGAGIQSALIKGNYTPVINITISQKAVVGANEINVNDAVGLYPGDELRHDGVFVGFIKLIKDKIIQFNDAITVELNANDNLVTVPHLPVYFGADSGRVYSMNGDMEKTNSRWIFPDTSTRVSSFVSPMALNGDNLYAVTRAGSIYRFNAITGKVTAGPINANTETGAFVNVCTFKDVPFFSADSGAIWQIKEVDEKATLSKYYGDLKVVTQFASADKFYMTDMTGGAFCLNSDMTIPWKYNYDFGKLLTIIPSGEDILAVTVDGKLICIVENGEYKIVTGGNAANRSGFTAPGILPDGGVRWSNNFTGPQSYSPVVAFMADTVRKTTLTKPVATGSRYLPVLNAENIYIGDYISIAGEDLGPVLEVIREKGKYQLYMRDATTQDYSIDTELGTLLYRRGKVSGCRMIEYNPLVKSIDTKTGNIWGVPSDIFFPRDNFTLDITMDINSTDKAEIITGLYLNSNDNDKRGELAISFKETCLLSVVNNDLRANCIMQEVETGKKNCTIRIEAFNGIITVFYMNDDKQFVMFGKLITDSKAAPRGWNIFANIKSTAIIQPVINLKWYPGAVLSKNILISHNTSSFTVDHGERLLSGDNIQLTQSATGFSDFLKVNKVDGNEVTFDADSRPIYDYTINDNAWVGSPAQWAIFSAGDDGVVRATDPDTGKQLWQNDLRGEMGAVRVPILVNSRLNRIYAASLSGRIFAFSQNGIFCGVYPDFTMKPTAPFSTPIVIDAANGIIAVDDAGTVYRINADGLLEWKLNSDAGKPIKISVFRWNEIWRILLVTDKKLLIISSLGEVIKQIDIGKVITTYSDDKLYILNDIGELKSYNDFENLNAEIVATDLPVNSTQLIPLASGWMAVTGNELIFTGKNGKKKFDLIEKINAVVIDNLGKIIVAAGNDIVCLPDISKWGDDKILWRKKMVSRVTGVSLWYSTVIAITEDGRMISVGAPRFDVKTEKIIPSIATDYNLTLLPGSIQPTLTDLPAFDDDLITDNLKDSNGINYLNQNQIMAQFPGFLINPSVINAVLTSDVPAGSNIIPVQSISNFYVGDRVIFTRQNGADPSGYNENYIITGINIVNSGAVKALVKLNKSINISRAAGDLMVLLAPEKYNIHRGVILPGQKVVFADISGAKFAFGPNGMDANGHFPVFKKKVYHVNNNADIVLYRSNYPEFTENLKIKIVNDDKYFDAIIKDVIINHDNDKLDIEKNVKKGSKIYALLIDSINDINAGDIVCSDSFTGEIIALEKSNSHYFATLSPDTVAYDDIKTDKMKIIHSFSSDIVLENINNNSERFRVNSNAIGLTGRVFNLTANYKLAVIGSDRFNDMRIYGITENAELFAVDILGTLKWRYNIPFGGKVLNIFFNTDKSVVYVITALKDKSGFYAIKLAGVDDEKRIITQSEIPGSFEKAEKDGNNFKLIGKNQTVIINQADGKVIKTDNGVNETGKSQPLTIEKMNTGKIVTLSNNVIDWVIIKSSGEVTTKQGDIKKLTDNIWKITKVDKNDVQVEININDEAIIIVQYADKLTVYNIRNGMNIVDAVLTHADNYYQTGIENPGNIYDALPDNLYTSVINKTFQHEGALKSDISGIEKINLQTGKYSQTWSGKYIDINNNGQWDFFEPIKKEETTEIVVDKAMLISRYPNIGNYILGNYDYLDDNSNFKMTRVGNEKDVIYDKNINVDAPTGLYTANSVNIDENISNKMQVNKLSSEEVVSDCKIKPEFINEVKRWKNYLDGAERNPTAMDINEDDTVVIVSSDTALSDTKPEENKVDTQLWIRHLKSIPITIIDDIKAGDKKITLLPEEIVNIHAAIDTTSDIFEVKNHQGELQFTARIISADADSITLDRQIKDGISATDNVVTVIGAPWQPLLTNDEITEIEDRFSDPGDDNNPIPHPIRYEYPSINYNADRMYVVFTVSAVKRVTINGQPQYLPASYIVVKKSDSWGRGDGVLDWVESDAPSERNNQRNAKSYPTLITGLPNLDKIIIYESGSRGIFCALQNLEGKWTTEIPFAEINASLDDITRARAWVEDNEKNTRFFNMIFSATKNGTSSLYYARYRSEYVNEKLTFTLQPLTIADIDIDGRMIDDLKEIMPGNFVGNYSAWQDLRVIIDGEEVKVAMPPGQDTFVYKGANNLKIQINPYRGTARVLTGKVQDMMFTGYPSLQKLTESPGADKMPTKIVYGDDIVVSWIREYPDWMGSRIYVGGWKLKRDPLFNNVVMRLEKNDINQQMVVLSGLENDSDVVSSDMSVSRGKNIRLFTIGWRDNIKPEITQKQTGRNDLFMSVVSIRN